MVEPACWLVLAHRFCSRNAACRQIPLGDVVACRIAYTRALDLHRVRDIYELYSCSYFYIAGDLLQSEPMIKHNTCLFRFFCEQKLVLAPTLFGIMRNVYFNINVQRLLIYPGRVVLCTIYTCTWYQIGMLGQPSTLV